MGFLDRLSSTLKGAVKEGARQGIATGISTSTLYTGINKFKNLQTYINNDSNDDNNKYRHVENVRLGMFNANTTSVKNKNAISEDAADENTAKATDLHKVIKTPDYYVVDDKFTDILNFEIPDWTYADWINERTLWQKQITNIFDEPGYFYFKIFFKFNTQHGLFGGLLNNSDFSNAINSAAKYLYISKSIYRQERPLERITALFKFASILSYINTSAPWYFKGISGLDNCTKPNINNFGEKKSIEIQLTQDAIDMRLTTLMSLYKFACYDDINCKEILPDNLRKFDMSIIVFATPIKHYHTSIKSGDKTFKYKSLSPLNGNGVDWSNVMSYKMYTFQNCEFDFETIGTYMPAQIDNAEPFKLGNNVIRINYDRCYEHNMNEYYGLMFGSDGIYYNQYSAWQWHNKKDDTINSKSGQNTQEQRYSALREAISSGNENIAYTQLVDASEGLIHNKLSNIMSSYALGNLYGEERMISTGYDANGKHPQLTDYYKMKLNHLKNRLSVLESSGKNIILKALQSSYDSYGYFGNLYGDTGVGSKYWKDKLKRLKDGNREKTDTERYIENRQSYQSFNLRDYMFQTTRNKK